MASLVFKVMVRNQERHDQLHGDYVIGDIRRVSIASEEWATSPGNASTSTGLIIVRNVPETAVTRLQDLIHRLIEEDYVDPIDGVTKKRPHARNGRVPWRLNWDALKNIDKTRLSGSPGWIYMTWREFADLTLSREVIGRKLLIEIPD